MKIRFGAQVVTTLALTFAMTMPVAAQPLPPDLDYPAAEKAYSEAKNVSDQARRLASSARTLLDSLSEEIIAGEAQKAQLQKESADNTDSIADRQRQIPELEQANRVKGEAITAEQTRISNLLTEIESATKEKIEVDAYVSDLETRFEPIRQERMQADERLSRLRQNSDRLEREAGKARQAEHEARVYVDSERQLTEKARRDVREAEEALDKAKGRVEELRKNKEEALARADRLESSAQAARGEIPALESKVRELEASQSRAEMALMNATGQKQRADKVQAEAFADFKRQEARVGQLIDELHDIERRMKDDPSLGEQHAAKIGELNSAADVLEVKRTTMNQANSAANAANETLEAAKAQVQQIKGQVAAAKGEVEGKKRQANELTAQAGEQRKKAAEFDREADGAKERMARLADNVREKERDLREIPRKIEEVRRNLPQYRQAVVDAERDVAVNNTRIRETVDRLRDLIEEQRELEALVAEQSARSTDLGREIAGLHADKSQAEQKVATIRAEISTNLAIIADHRVQIPALTKRNTEIVRELAALEVKLAATRTSKARAQTDFDTKNATATRAELVTKEKSDRMLVVKDKYDQLVNAALADGSRQGEAGTEVGNKDGEVDGSATGKPEGETLGRNAGLLDGYENGRQIGRDIGDRNGYAAGLADEDVRKTGYKNGQEHGAELADIEARPLRASAALALRQRLLATLPSNRALFDNTTANGAPAPLTNHVFAANETAQPGEFVRVNIESTRDEFGAPDDIFKALGIVMGPDPVGACRYTGGDRTKPAKLPQPTCAYPYTVVREACLKAHADSYQSHYASAYSSSYKVNFSKSCEIAYPAKYNQAVTERVEEGRKSTYDDAYATGRKRGAKQNSDAAFQSGTVDGKAAALPGAIAKYTALGESDTNTFFATNAVTRLVEAKVEKTSQGSKDSFVAGDQVHLRVDIANFGAVATERGQVKMKVQLLSNNASLPAGQNWVDLVALPGQTLSTVTKVLPIDIKPGIGAETISLKVLMQAANGEITEMPLSFQTVEHVSVTLTKISSGFFGGDGYKTPRLGSEQKVNMTFKNISRVNPTEELLAELTALNVPEGAVELTRKWEKLPSRDMGSGNEKTVELKFKVHAKELVGQKVTFLITVHYKNNVSFKQTFVVTPTN